MRYEVLHRNEIVVEQDYLERLEDAVYHLVGDWERAEETGVPMRCSGCKFETNVRVPPLINMRHYNEVLEEARRRRALEGRPALTWTED